MATWVQRVADTVAEEFSDLPDAEQLTRVCVRLTVAVLLGGVLGYERESRAKAAGLRRLAAVQPSTPASAAPDSNHPDAGPASRSTPPPSDPTRR